MKLVSNMITFKEKQNNPASTQKRKKRLAEIFKKPATSHKLRAVDLATREVEQYIHSLVLM